MVAWLQLKSEKTSLNRHPLVKCQNPGNLRAFPIQKLLPHQIKCLQPNIIINDKQNFQLTCNLNTIELSGIVLSHTNIQWLYK